VARKAVNIILEDYLDLIVLLNNLGSKLKSQYKYIGKIEDIKKVIQVT